MVGTFHVAISTGCEGYPSEPPYSPFAAHPEYPFGSEALAGQANQAYDGVRDTLRLLDLDIDRYGCKDWNPMGEIVHPGDTVLLKPNFVRDFRETHVGDENCLITHGSVIRAALDYAYIALKGSGRIIIADAPQNDADFDVIRQMAGLDEIQRFYQDHADFEVEVYDLRPERAKKIDGVIVGHERLPGDPAGYVKVDLNEHSAFVEIQHLCHLLYGAEYDTAELRSHHHDRIHEYLISKTILDADCIINLPKLKTHKKTGITISMKNLVGINGNKNWLPHYREGTPSQGGDQFADDRAIHRIEQRAMACFRYLFPLFGPLRGVMAKPLKALGKKAFGDTCTNVIRSGNWYGNDTTWRMAIDLNRALMYANENGGIQDNPSRRILCIVDGIVGGEGNGPLDPTPRAAGMVLAGMNPVVVDLVGARLMGFDYKLLPVLREAMAEHSLPMCASKYDEIVCRSCDPNYDRRLSGLVNTGLNFRPDFGWRGHIELDTPQASEE